MTIYNDKITDQIAKVIADNIIETALGHHIYVWQFVSELVQRVTALHMNYEGGNGLRDKVEELYEKSKKENDLPDGLFVKFPDTSFEEIKAGEDALTQLINSQGRLTDKQHLQKRLEQK